MPKELVFGCGLPYSDVSSAQSVVGVHWGREAEYVQMSTMLFNDDLKYSTFDGEVHTSEGQEAFRRKLWAEGFYVDLDRKGINDLIRFLRKARDQAFGQDE